MYKLMPSCFDLINKINVIGLIGGCGRGGIILIMSLKMRDAVFWNSILV